MSSGMVPLELSKDNNHNHYLYTFLLMTVQNYA